MEKLGKVINLDEYRQRNQPRYSDEERQLMDRFKSTHPAGKAQAKEALMNDPSFVVRIIEDKLADNGYPQKYIDRVGYFWEELQGGYPDAPTRELSNKIWSMFNASMSQTYAEIQARQAEIAAAKASKGGVVLSITRNANKSNS